MSGPVTALGIRDGDPAVLRALIARRGSAVVAYCERACAPAQVPIAAADAFARFRALVIAAPRPADLDPEAALLSSTRHAAAARAPRGQAPPAGAGLGKLLGGRPTADQITLVPDLLIARADGTLDADGEEQLNRLLDASASARAAEERFRAAEHAYRSAPPRPIPEDLIVQIVAAMTAVPADAPAPAAPTAPEAAPSADEEPTEMVDEPASEEEPAAEEEADEAPARDTAEVADEPTPHEEEEPTVAEEPEIPADEEHAEEVGVTASRSAAVAAEGGEATREWDVPPEEIGHREALDVEIAAARLTEPSNGEVEDDRTGAAAAHLQTASGAVDEPLVEEGIEAAPPARPVPPAPPVPPAAATPSSRPGLPGKGALAPAAAVVAVAAVSILATSGVLGGDESQPAVDTGVAPKATQVEVPEGEAAAVIEELRRAAGDARRQRLADRGTTFVPPVQEEEPAPAPEAEEEAPAPSAPEDNADEDTGGAEAGTTP